MQCSVMLGRDNNSGDVKMKTVNSYKNPYKKVGPQFWSYIVS